MDVRSWQATNGAGEYHRMERAMFHIGPKPKCRDIRDLVAIEWKADTTRTSQK